jgi:3-hydroxyisobutyrate dehydrogenase
VRTLQATPLGMPYAFAKIDLMEKHQYPAGFAVDLALKDLELTLQTAKLRLPFLEAVRERLKATVRAVKLTAKPKAVPQTKAD